MKKIILIALLVIGILFTDDMSRAACVTKIIMLPEGTTQICAICDNLIYCY
ncbi:MAG: hypothetical protein WA941_12125 [Nitrososphaeraceae archaeon]